jgi:hypothetical protein
MYGNKTFFFLKWEINLNYLRFFLNFVEIFLENVLEETRYFNTRFVPYNVSIQFDIMQNW